MRIWFGVLAFLLIALPAVSADEADLLPETSESAEAPPSDPLALPGDALGEDPLALPGDALGEDPLALPSDTDEEDPLAALEATALEEGMPAALDSVETEGMPAALDESLETPSLAAAAASEGVKGIVLGPEGRDTQGRRGRVHTVAVGDTLWDISEAYLGTPWVWPSIWEDNRVIENPHLINPDDRIWITSNLMMPITAEEAEAFITAGLDEAPADTPEFESGSDLAFDQADEPEPENLEADAEQDPLAIGAANGAGLAETGETIKVRGRDGISFLAGEPYESTAAVIGSPLYRTWYVQGDTVYVGLGRGEVNVGDEFSIFRESKPVYEWQTGRLLGYHVEVVAWGEISAVDEESSKLLVHYSGSEFESGDRITPRQVKPTEIPLRLAPSAFQGHIVYLPNQRATMGMLDYVYIDRGALHGLREGMQLEAFAAGKPAYDESRRESLLTPDLVFAELVVIEVEPDTAVAMVTRSITEVEVGNAVRARTESVASSMGTEPTD